MLKSIDLPDSVINISKSAFYDSGLITINISLDSKLEQLDDYCFENSKLSTFFIPRYLKKAYSRTFLMCPLQNITSDPRNLIYKSDNSSVFVGATNSTLFKVVPAYTDQYEIPSYVYSISENCFYGCNISSIQFNDKVTSIAKSAFGECKLLTSVTIPDQLTSIGEGAFFKCTSLTKVVLPENFERLSDTAFFYCTALTDIKIPQRVSFIGQTAFSNCESLTSIVLPEKITSIPNSLFSYCKSLSNVTFNGKITSIGNYAFASCESLTTFTIPETVRSIGNGVFQLCKNLTSITFMNNDNTITMNDKIFYYINKPINIYINGTLKISTSYPNQIFRKSHLYVTSQTILSEDSKLYFGPKSVYVHLEGTTDITDERTLDVINYIAIPPKKSQTYPVRDDFEAMKFAGISILLFLKN